MKVGNSYNLLYRRPTYIYVYIKSTRHQTQRVLTTIQLRQFWCNSKRKGSKYYRKKSTTRGHLWRNVIASVSVICIINQIWQQMLGVVEPLRKITISSKATEDQINKTNTPGVSRSDLFSRYFVSFFLSFFFFHCLGSKLFASLITAKTYHQV